MVLETLLTPTLRFPEFSGEWEEKRLDSLFSFVSTNSLSRSELQWEESNVANIHYGDIHTKYSPKFIFSQETVPFLKPDSLKFIENSNFVQNGDLLFADASEDTNDIGKMIEVLDIGNKNIVAGLHVIHAIPKAKNAFYTGFLADLFQSRQIRKQIIKESQGAKVLGVSSKKIGKIILFTPTLPEQQKIADFLTAVDARIAHLQQKHTLLQTYKKGLMQQLFSQALRFTQPNGSPYPAWEEKRLGEVFNERSERGNPEAELLSVTLNQGIVKASLMDRTISASTDRGNYKTVYTNDIVYNSMRMWQGASGVSSCYGIVSPAYTVIIPNQNQDSLFWAYYFKLSKNIHIFKRCSQGLTSDTWNLKFPAFSKIKMFFPCKEEQQKIAACLTAVDAKISLTAQAIQHAQAFKKGLLQQMFV